LKEWSPYLLSSPHKTKVISDHHSLIYFATSHNLTRRHARWKVELNQFNIKIIHRPGAASGKPDALSRRPDFDKGEDDNKNLVLIPHEKFLSHPKDNPIPTEEKVNLILFSHHLFVLHPNDLPSFTINTIGTEEEMDLSEAIAKAQMTDPFLLPIKTHTKSNLAKGWECNNQELWRFQGRIYVPLVYRKIVFYTLHSHITSGHPGQKPTLEKVERHYYWPDLKNDVVLWVRNCNECQRFKPFPQKKHGLLKPNLIPSWPWEVVTMDLLTDLPELEGYNAILVVVD
jgi:hypothetical protein